MKKKNYYWSFMIAVAMTVMSVGFASCGDDDDEPGSGSNSALVGTWAQYHKGGATAWYIGLKLEKNGSAYYTEWDTKNSPNWGTPGKWNAAGDKLSISDPNGNVVYTSYYAISEDGKTLSLNGDLVGGSYATLKGLFEKQ